MNPLIGQRYKIDDIVVEIKTIHKRLSIHCVSIEGSSLGNFCFDDCHNKNKFYLKGQDKPNEI